MALCAGMVGMTILVGCGGPSAPAESEGKPANSAVAPAPAILDQGAAPRGKQSFNSDAPAATRKEVVTGTVNLRADDPLDAAGRLVDRVRAGGGRVDGRTEQPGTDDDPAKATLTVRVPADQTDRFITGLGDLGKVTKISTNRDDVTMRWEDLDARIHALQATVDRLRGLITAAANTADLIAAENALSSRQGELDSLTAQKRHLDDEIALSALTIQITGKAKDSGSEGFLDGVVGGWHALVRWLGDAVVFTGRAIPWLGFFAILAALVTAVVRGVRQVRRGRGSRQSTPDTAAETVAAGTGAAGADGAGDNQAEQS
ncbi:DUF4349 domain-containing protein [Nocardia panacis]|uniref:DUF4349 domain-containing protein n=2 Tax=Nocardia panacis TaxID=2340916 RepID=A0A3A4KHT5_9NOCA|nr:DUF4349 domain-containing protein [Nocardia panacis]